MQWTIYLLHNKQGIPFYVGSTNDIDRRLREHKKVFGYKPLAIILETGKNKKRNEAEQFWIDKCRCDGIKLTNKAKGTNDGRWTHIDSTRQKISRQQKGRVKTAEHSQKIGDAQRGRAKKWSAAGIKNVRKTQFKKGQNALAVASEEARERHRASCRRNWENISAEERSRMATERNLKAWAKRSKAERKRIGEKIAESNRRFSAAKKAAL